METPVATLHVENNAFIGYVSEAFRATCRQYGFDIGKITTGRGETGVSENAPKQFVAHLRAELLHDLVNFAIVPEAYKWDEHNTGMVFAPSGRNGIEHIGTADTLAEFRETVFRHIIKESIL